MRLANRLYTQVKVEISEGLGGGSRQPVPNPEVVPNPEENDPIYRALAFPVDALCRDPPPSPSLTSTFTCVYERLTSLTGGVHDDG